MPIKEKTIEPLMTPAEVKEVLRIGLSTVYHLAERGELPGAIKYGGSLRINRDIFEKSLSGEEIKKAKTGSHV